MSHAQQPSPAAYAAAAWMIDCEEAAIRAVAEVESGASGAFLPTGEPAILYEPHIFSELTAHKFDASHPKLSYPKWKPGAYGKMSDQHGKLREAAKLNRDAALMACSWGLFQILGRNHKRAGFGTVQGMVTAAYRDVDAHLRMFVNFIITDERLAVALRSKDWATFARFYNGPGFAANRYDTKMKAAYDRLVKK